MYTIASRCIHCIHYLRLRSEEIGGQIYLELKARDICDKTKEWTDYLSNKHQKFDGILLMIYACGFGLRPLLKVILYRLLSFGGTLAVRCPE